MAIHIKCPNGHGLTAKESNAGKTGKCPVCKAPVKIPVLLESHLSDSAILDILGGSGNISGACVSATVTPKVMTKTSTAGAGNGQTHSTGSATLPHTKVCPSCEREIDMGYHICPHCHTYITGLNDF